RAVTTATLPRRRLFEGKYDGARDGIGHAEAAAQVLEGVAERVERGDHARARPGERLGVGPLGDDAVGAIAGLDHVRPLQARPIGFGLAMGVEEVLLAPGL